MNDQLPLFREVFHRRERRSVPLARAFARAALVDWNLDARTDDVLVCVSELATNALLHGVPPGRGYRLQLLLERGPGLRYVLRVEVHDSGDGVPARRAPEGESGRGLHLVAALADRWGVGERNPGKIVWCEFHSTPGAPAPEPDLAPVPVPAPDPESEALTGTARTVAVHRGEQPFTLPPPSGLLSVTPPA